MLEVCREKNIQKQVNSLAAIIDSMNAHRAEAVLDTFKAAEKEVHPAGTVYFGPGFLNMAEYHFMKKNGHNRFAILLSEPSIGYDWDRS